MQTLSYRHNASRDAAVQKCLAAPGPSLVPALRVGEELCLLGDAYAVEILAGQSE